MSRRNRFARDVLVRTAASSTSLVDLLCQLGAPLGSGPLRYLRTRLERYGIDTSHFVEQPLPERARRSYSREVLMEAAAHSHSIREMFEYMGLPPSDSPYGYVRRKLDRLEIDTSHFAKGHNRRSPLPGPEELASVVSRSVSLAEVLRRLGHADNGGTRARLKRAVDEHGISTAHFIGQGHTRGAVSPYRKSATEVLRRAEPGSQRIRTALLRRALDDIGAPRECASCGIGEIWQGKRLVLEIDHVNGDRVDNRRENLRYLCPSCHSQTKNFSKQHGQTQ
ncbi:HNH endonuclease [Streptomyces sp. NBC_01754]|uniref:HNH endonuclease n=1 Tax=Streptomyces sp. NBC_01754 TaxID=2975930 RepID=UPI002DDC5F76|nr:HNH endonuclease signature motif containing protein [Streptomyces sp. NBC_01754]WSC92685.1 HNH endonuclease [Streptomyces sp. NBC_01754]